MLKKLIIFAQFVVILIVGGYVAYVMSKGIPIPGGKFLMIGPFLTLVLMVLLERFPKYGSLTLVNAVFALVMIFVTPWMSAAILLSGALGDLVNLIPINHWIKRATSLGVYNLVSLLSSVYISIFVTGNVLYGLFTPTLLLIIGLLSFLLGFMGAAYGRKINAKYLSKI